MGRGRGFISGRICPLSFSAQNFSKAAPGPNPFHGRLSILDTLSNAHPMLSSTVVAIMLKFLTEVASNSKVWPPDTKSVKNGYFGRSGSGVVRNGVRA